MARTSFARPAVRELSLVVTEKVATKLDELAKAGGIKTTTLVGQLFDAAYASRVKGTPDASLDAHVSLVGLAHLSGADLEQVALGSGLPLTTVERMRDGWRTVLDERRRGQPSTTSTQESQTA